MTLLIWAELRNTNNCVREKFVSKSIDCNDNSYCVQDQLGMKKLKVGQQNIIEKNKKFRIIAYDSLTELL